MVPKCFYCGQITTCIYCMIGLQLIRTPWPQQRFKKQTKKKKGEKVKKVTTLKITSKFISQYCNLS